MSKTALRYGKRAEKLKEYQVKVSLTYVGVVTVRADSKKHAVDIVGTDVIPPEITKCEVEVGSLSQDAYGIVMEDDEYIGLEDVELKIDKKKKHIR